MFDQLPACVHTLLQDGNWKGGAIVRLDNALTRCSAADVAINFHMLRPIISFSSDKAPQFHFFCNFFCECVFQVRLVTCVALFFPVDLAAALGSVWLFPHRLHLEVGQAVPGEDVGRRPVKAATEEVGWG